MIPGLRRPGRAMLVVVVLLLMSGVPVLAQNANDNGNKQTPAPREESAELNTSIEKSGNDAERPATTPSSVSPGEAILALRPSPAKAFDPGAATRGAQGPASDRWHFAFSPYLFMASLKGDAGIRDRSAEVDAKFTDIIDEVNFGFMGAFEARKNRFVFLTDLMYLNLSDSTATPRELFFSSVKVDFKAFILDPEVGYRLVDNDRGSVDAMVGFRYWHLRTRLELRAGILPDTEVTGTRNWADVVGGMRGRANINDKWFLTGKGDVGGGASDITWQLFGAVGYNLCEKGSLVLGYRYLKTDYDNDGFLFDIAMKGPVLGFTFRF